MKVVLVALFLAACGTRTPLELGTETGEKGHHHHDDGKHHDDGGTGPSCDEVCDRWRDCGLDDAETCDGDCPPLRSGMSDEAWDATFGECLADPCNEVEECVEHAVTEVAPEEYHLQFCEAACERADECGNPEPDCVDRVCSGESELGAVPLFAEKVIAELTACLSRDCGPPMDACGDGVMEKHGLDAL